jgi:hypothetical protein
MFRTFAAAEFQNTESKKDPEAKKAVGKKVIYTARDGITDNRSGKTGVVKEIMYHDYYKVIFYDKSQQPLMTRITDHELALCVAPGLNSLSKAVEEAKKAGITAIFLENGTHNENGNVVVIDFPLTITGESREHCIVIGGLKMRRGKEEDDVNVSSLTLRDSKGNGVFGWNGASIHLDNVSVENSRKCGVRVDGTKRNTMKNCNVSYSKESGLFVWGDGLMTIDGNATNIHHNGTNGHGYGLYTYNSSSSIHLVSPLTKEMISTKNHRGRNYGGEGTIKSVGFMKGDTVFVLLDGDLVNGEVINVSAGDGVKVKYENGKEGGYTPTHLKRMIENGNQEKLAREKAAAEFNRNGKIRDRLAREKAAQDMLVQEKTDREEIMVRVGDRSALRVKPGLNSLSKAVKKAKEKGITAIFLLNGKHDEKNEVVNIKLSISIIGESREHCVVMGGLEMEPEREKNNHQYNIDVNVSNLTLRGSEEHGVCGYRLASLYLENVSVENSEGVGVSVYGNERSTMKNCNISHSKLSGLWVDNDGLMTIKGNGTTIHNNCTEGDSGNHGLTAGGRGPGSIHLVSPLTIETISKNNGGGGNYGGEGTIKSVDKDGKVLKVVYDGVNKMNSRIEEERKAVIGW